MIDERTALLRVAPARLDDLLHPVFKQGELDSQTEITKGLPASPGAATGQIVFFADEAEEWVRDGKQVVLVRTETSPEDLRGMSVAQGILTARGGMTSHAAVVARGMGKCCVSGAGSIHIDYHARKMFVDGKEYNEGDWISLNGTTGRVYAGKIATEEPTLSGDFGELMKLTNKYARLKVRTNADTPEEAVIAHNFGAQGIGLCRTEHMFFEGDRIVAVREMILADDEAGRRKALAKLLPMQRGDFEKLLEEMHDLPVTIRLLDPPLHEFVPHTEEAQLEMAKDMGVSVQKIREKVEELHEFNPMMGHRGCRLGITYHEITEMQTRAIIEAALNVKRKGINCIPEIMIPLVMTAREFREQAAVVRNTAEQVFKERGDKIRYHIGTMIEVPRAAMTADYIANDADFFSFGTNDLTQMTFGFSRDDSGKFLPIYIEKGLVDGDPFAHLDRRGVGQLVKIAAEKGRSVKPQLPLGVCGEHGGDPESIEFVHQIGLDYVSCSPYRVPIARLAAAQAAIKHELVEEMA
jgi:pyruvate,orthophosphate dikinase